MQIVEFYCKVKENNKYIFIKYEREESKMNKRKDLEGRIKYRDFGCTTITTR